MNHETTNRRMGPKSEKPHCVQCGSSGDIEGHHGGGRNHLPQFIVSALSKASRQHDSSDQASRSQHELHTEQQSAFAQSTHGNHRPSLDFVGRVVARNRTTGEIVMKQEIYLRAHTVASRQKPKKSLAPEQVTIWPSRILIFDTETTIDAQQDLTFGAYQLCQLKEGKYICSEEGLFHRDDLDARQLKVLTKYVETGQAQIEVKRFPPRLNLKLYPRWEFLEKVFWKAIKNERMIVGFNLPFDLSRLAVEWATADNGGWSLILSQRRSKKTGMIESHPHRPRVRITAKDSKSAFISLTKPRKPEEWPKRSRFLDVHTLAFALFANSQGLDALCSQLKIPGKLKHEPTGRITIDEIEYCRGDVRCTTAVLNALKLEFDQHGLELRPDRAYSPASMAKSYFRKMEVVPPRVKFKVPDRVHGIAMQAYYGGRAECRIRHTLVPVAHTDFTSEYPTVNALLGNWKVLTAESISFDSATDEKCVSCL